MDYKLTYINLTNGLEETDVIRITGRLNETEQDKFQRALENAEYFLRHKLISNLKIEEVEK